MWTRSRDLFLKFAAPLYLWNGHFKFGAQIDGQAYKLKNAKVGQKGRGLHHMIIILTFPVYLWNGYG